MLLTSASVSGQSLSSNATIPQFAPVIQLSPVASNITDPAVAAMGPTMSRLAYTHSVPPPLDAFSTGPTNNLPRTSQPASSHANRLSHVNHLNRIGMHPEKDSHRLRAMFNTWNAEIFEAKRGLKFPYTPKPALTIVVDQLPKTLRNAAFFSKWTREASGGGEPKLVAVDARASKVLVEFHTAQAALNAWMSPLLAPPPRSMEKGKSREDLVRVWHYIPSNDPNCLAISQKSEKKELEEGEIEDDRKSLGLPAVPSYIPPSLPPLPVKPVRAHVPVESKKARAKRLKREREQQIALEQEMARQAISADYSAMQMSGAGMGTAFHPQLMAEMFNLNQAFNYGPMQMPMSMQPFLQANTFQPIPVPVAAPVPAAAPSPKSQKTIWQSPIPQPSDQQELLAIQRSEVKEQREDEDVYRFDTETWESSNGSDAEFSDQDSDDMLQEDETDVSDPTILTPPPLVALTDDNQVEMPSFTAIPPDTPTEGITPSTGDNAANPFSKAFSHDHHGQRNVDYKGSTLSSSLLSTSASSEQDLSPSPATLPMNSNIDDRLAREQELRRLVLASRASQQNGSVPRAHLPPLASQPSFGTMATAFIAQTIDDTAKQMANQEKLSLLEKEIAQRKLEIEQAQRARAARSAGGQKRTGCVECLLFPIGVTELLSISSVFRTSSPITRKVPQSGFRGCWPQIPFNNFFLVLSDEEDDYDS